MVRWNAAKFQKRWHLALLIRWHSRRKRWRLSLTLLVDVPCSWRRCSCGHMAQWRPWCQLNLCKLLIQQSTAHQTNRFRGIRVVHSRRDLDLQGHRNLHWLARGNWLFLRYATFDKYGWCSRRVCYTCQKHLGWVFCLEWQRTLHDRWKLRWKVHTQVLVAASSGLPWSKSISLSRWWPLYCSTDSAHPYLHCPRGPQHNWW